MLTSYKITVAIIKSMFYSCPLEPLLEINHLSNTHKMLSFSELLMRRKLAPLGLQKNIKSPVSSCRQSESSHNSKSFLLSTTKKNVESDFYRHKFTITVRNPDSAISKSDFLFYVNMTFKNRKENPKQCSTVQRILTENIDMSGKKEWSISLPLQLRQFNKKTGDMLLFELLVFKIKNGGSRINQLTARAEFSLNLKNAKQTFTFVQKNNFKAHVIYVDMGVDSLCRVSKTGITPFNAN